jgi:uncharacterized DUF497 family protein
VPTKVYELIVEPGRDEHIARYQVTVQEAEEVVFGSPAIHRTRDDRYRLVGQTAAGRYLTVIVAPRGQGVYGLVTAREATEAERRQYRTQRRP